MGLWRTILIGMVVLAGTAGCLWLDEATPRFDAPKSLTLSGPTIEQGQHLPREHTCDGEGRSPGLEISGIPDGTATVTIVISDPDAPGRSFVHWILWGVHAGESEIALTAGSPPEEARQGANDQGGQGYAPPCPPAGEPEHRYFVRAFAVDRKLEVPEGADREEVFSAMEGHVVAWGELMATYERR